MFTLSDPANNEFDIWLKANGVYLAIGVASLLLITIVVILILSKKKSKIDVKNETTSPKINIKDLVGGGDNIIKVSMVGSRISLELKDYSLVKEDLLTEAGVLSFIKMSKKITLVCNKGDVQSIYDALC